MSDRQDQIEAFLKQAGWQNASREALTADASTRTYHRLGHGGKNALLMNAPLSAEQPCCPPVATPEERRSLGYNAEARLAGPNLHAFVETARLLREAGLSAPDIYAFDAGTGLALIEDLGDDLYARYIASPDKERDLYAIAVEALAHLHQFKGAWPVSSDYTFQEYDDVALLAETRLLTQWYLPYRRGLVVTDQMLQDYDGIWMELLEKLTSPAVFVMRDYHAENLLWLPGRDGIRRTGVIDFQDGLIGQPAYDLVSLLEDARRDVLLDLVQEMRGRYVRCMKASDNNFSQAAFESDYSILAAQRNAKILGIFARLVKRDGKPKYDGLLPRVEQHFRRDLARPGLERLRDWVKNSLPTLEIE
ncbi:MAG: phosphotransferase [Aquisalinus sp.]|nr:phosphotransferase [Aquisalinus sp.]